MPAAPLCPGSGAEDLRNQVSLLKRLATAAPPAPPRGSRGGGHGRETSPPQRGEGQVCPNVAQPLMLSSRANPVTTAWCVLLEAGEHTPIPMSRAWPHPEATARSPGQTPEASAGCRCKRWQQRRPVHAHRRHCGRLVQAAPSPGPSRRPPGSWG